MYYCKISWLINIFTLLLSIVIMSVAHCIGLQKVLSFGLCWTLCVCCFSSVYMFMLLPGFSSLAMLCLIHVNNIPIYYGNIYFFVLFTSRVFKEDMRTRYNLAKQNIQNVMVRICLCGVLFYQKWEGCSIAHTQPLKRP